MERKLLKLTAIVVILVFALSTFSVAVSAEDRTAYLKRKASEAAEIFREMGYPEDSAAIRICQLAYADASGQITRDTYLHDSTSGKKYYLLSPNTYSNGNGYNSSASWGEDYWDGQYYWYFDSYYQKYYRFDRNGSKTWMSKEVVKNTTSTATSYRDVVDGSGNIGNTNLVGVVNTYGTSTYLNGNITGYNYTYQGVRLYSGRIYGLECATDRDRKEVETLAHLINSYIPEADIVGKAAFGWSILDLGRGIPTSAVEYYDYYNPNSYSDWDMEEFCKELIFRYNAERKGGSVYVGRILPEGYGYIRTQNSYQAEFSQTANGSAYGFPYLYSSTKSQYHSPY